jgi:hypothetical protein
VAGLLLQQRRAKLAGQLVSLNTAAGYMTGVKFTARLLQCTLQGLVNIMMWLLWWALQGLYKYMVQLLKGSLQSQCNKTVQLLQ